MATSRAAARNSVVSSYFSEIRHLPLLTREEEKSLARDIQEGSHEAVNTLVESNLGFVAKVASEYRSCGLPFEDLLNEGNLGLIEAARRFDPDREAKFISYAIWWIRKTIRRALTEQGRLVRQPYSHRKRVKAIDKTGADLRKELGREPTREEIAEALDLTVERVDRTRRVATREVSLDEPMAESDSTAFAAQLEDESWVSPESTLMDRDLGRGVLEAFDALNEQQKIVIAHRFGLNGEGELTLQETGERIGLSRERVRQIESQALVRMRKTIERRDRQVDAPAKAPRPAMAMGRRPTGASVRARPERTACA